MRKLVALAVVVVLVAAYLVADTMVRHRVERDLAARVDHDVPGATSTVSISSWPFTGRLAASGQVQTLRARVTGVKVGNVPVDLVTLVVDGLTVSRSQLVHGRVQVRSIRSATVTATITQASLDTGTGLPVTLGAGTVGLGPLQVPATVSVAGGHLHLGVPGLASIALPLLPAALLPCAATAVIVPGRLDLSCTTSALPPALVGASA